MYDTTKYTNKKEVHLLMIEKAIVKRFKIGLKA